jgi:superfamily II DNA/RNA helicase
VTVYEKKEDTNILYIMGKNGNQKKRNRETLDLICEKDKNDENLVSKQEVFEIGNKVIPSKEIIKENSNENRTLKKYQEEDNTASSYSHYVCETKKNETIPTINDSQEQVTFQQLGVCEEICETLQAIGWTIPTDIQKMTLPYALKGRDVIGLAETGSGKTGAFAIPVIQKILENPTHRAISALVLAPTRELTVQIADQFLALGCSIGLKVCTIVGGLDMVSQAMELTKKVHVVVGTPGRIVDHLENTKGFHLSHIMTLVMDEADRLLSMDFEEAINKILQVVPSNRITYLFSATMTSRVSKLQRVSLTNPVKVLFIFFKLY